jgi:hypothetical protein
MIRRIINNKNFVKFNNTTLYKYTFSKKYYEIQKDNTPVFPYAKKVFTELENLNKDPISNENYEEIVKKSRECRMKVYRIINAPLYSNEDNIKVIGEIFKEFNCQNYSELVNKCKELYARENKIKRHKELIKQKEDELSIWNELNNKLSIQTTSYDEEICELFAQRIAIDNKLRTAFYNRKNEIIEDNPWGI